LRRAGFFARDGRDPPPHTHTHTRRGLPCGRRASHTVAQHVRTQHASRTRSAQNTSKCITRAWRNVRANAAQAAHGAMRARHRNHTHAQHAADASAHRKACSCCNCGVETVERYNRFRIGGRRPMQGILILQLRCRNRCEVYFFSQRGASSHVRHAHFAIAVSKPSVVRCALFRIEVRRPMQGMLILQLWSRTRCKVCPFSHRGASPHVRCAKFTTAVSKSL
jgi:hypothetical protein